VRNASRVPIAAGGNIYSRYGYRPFLEKEALGVIQPDVSKTGGLLETRKIAAMAEVYNIPIAPHGGGAGRRDHPEPDAAGVHPLSRCVLYIADRARVAG
jgi:L-alanine-DL-glutamate epimerase-like enolase superfamily enzyme